MGELHTSVKVTFNRAFSDRVETFFVPPLSLDGRAFQLNEDLIQRRAEKTSQNEIVRLPGESLVSMRFPSRRPPRVVPLHELTHTF